ncbi:hypothetical protein KBD75_03395 [Candidatus Woesebacteria bacterium]|jgi:hypothetical protein|nr:hypothetical protein [Candidatus Woesebacteria bacterium]
MAVRDTILVSKTLYQIGVVTLITAIMWVGIVVYQAATKPLAVEIDKSILEPINTTIDQETITAITNRLKIEPRLIELTASESATIEEDKGI